MIGWLFVMSCKFVTCIVSIAFVSQDHRVVNSFHRSVSKHVYGQRSCHQMHLLWKWEVDVLRQCYKKFKADFLSFRKNYRNCNCHSLQASVPDFYLFCLWDQILCFAHLNLWCMNEHVLIVNKTCGQQSFRQSASKCISIRKLK